MNHNFIDLMPVVASDQRTLAAEVIDYLKRGWHVHGDAMQMRRLKYPSALIYLQWVVLTEEARAASSIEHVPIFTQAPTQRR